MSELSIEISLNKAAVTAASDKKDAEKALVYSVVGSTLSRGLTNDSNSFAEYRHTFASPYFNVIHPRQPAAAKKHRYLRPFWGNSSFQKTSGHR